MSNPKQPKGVHLWFALILVVLTSHAFFGSWIAIKQNKHEARLEVLEDLGISQRLRALELVAVMEKANEAMQPIYASAYIHGVDYDGPIYTPEVQAMQAAIENLEVPDER